MSKRTRRNHVPAFRAKVALAAVKVERTLAGIMIQRRVDPDPACLVNATVKLKSFL